MATSIEKTPVRTGQRIERASVGRAVLRTLLVSCIVGGAMVSGYDKAKAAEVCLVKDGKALGPIVLPEKTELEVRVAVMAEAILEADKTGRMTPEKAQVEGVKQLEKELKARLGHGAKLVDEELLAAEELQEFIEKISGATLAVVRAKGGALPAGPAILLGTAIARQQGFGEALDKLDKDGILLQTMKDKVVLAGRRARGTLYASYEFLESLGVRWVMPGEFGEIYPSTKTITAAVAKVENPAHSQRYWWATSGSGKGFDRWMLRNKGNRVKTFDDDTINQSHGLGRPLKWGAKNPKYGHKEKRMVKRYRRDPKTGKAFRDKKGVALFDMVEEQVDTLPEDYYALWNNKLRRNTPNMSNPKVWDLFVDYFVDYFTKNPTKNYATLSAEDGWVRDSRESTRAISSNEYDWLQGGLAATDRLWFFHNRVISRVVEQFPDKKFGILVYANNTSPPRLERVHPNMALVYAPLSVSPLHHVRDPKSKTNRTYRKWLESWAAQAKAVGAESYYYDYFPLGFSWNVFMICPQWPIIGKNYPWFHTLGLTGHTTQGYDDWGASHFNNWVAIRLYWKADQDYRAIIKDYCRIRFGQAAPAVVEYCRILEKRMAEIPDLCSNEVWGNHLILTPEVRRKCREALARGIKNVDTDRARKHLQVVIDMQASTDAWCDGIEIARETGDFLKAREVMEKSFVIRDKLNALYSHFVNPTRTDKDNWRRYTSGGWYNKYGAFNETISKARRAVILPRMMRVALDTDNTAWAKGWHKPEVSVEHLEEWDSTQVADIKYGTHREVSATFYRTEVKVPKDFGAGKATLYFPSLIARAMQIWINGKPVSFDYGSYKDTIWRGDDFFWMNYNHEEWFDVSGMVKPGQVNTIAFRVYKSYDHAGPYDRIFLLADLPEGE